MGDITKNFSYSEFRPKSESPLWKPSGYQKILIGSLASNLQVLRDHITGLLSMIITSGVRDNADYERLLSKGYNPSPTSDHFCGTAVKVQVGTTKYDKFGETYNFAVGAADIVPKGISAMSLFMESMKLVKAGKCDFGQVIYEKNPNSGSEWVHYGGIASQFFSNDIIELIKRSKFMHSMDNGKTYSIIQ